MCKVMQSVMLACEWVTILIPVYRLKYGLLACKIQHREVYGCVWKESGSKILNFGKIMPDRSMIGMHVSAVLLHIQSKHTQWVCVLWDPS